MRAIASFHNSWNLYKLCGVCFPIKDLANYYDTYTNPGSIMLLYCNKIEYTKFLKSCSLPSKRAVALFYYHYSQKSFPVFSSFTPEISYQ
jgi:hypothetical protein